MTIKELIQALGGAREVARKVGRRPSAIRMWVHNGYVPPKQHERVTRLATEHGVDISACDLDPA